MNNGDTIIQRLSMAISVNPYGVELRQSSIVWSDDKTRKQKDYVNKLEHRFFPNKIIVSASTRFLFTNTFWLIF